MKGWQGALEKGILSLRERGRKKWLLVLLIVLPLLAALALWIYPRKAPDWQPDPLLLKVAGDLDHYEASLVLHPESRELAISLTLTLKNRGDRPYEDLVLRTWPGAYERLETSPAAHEGLYEFFYPNGFSAGGITLYDVLWQGKAVGHAFLDEARTLLRLSISALAPGESGQVDLRCVIKVPESPGRLGVDGDTWTLGNILPVLAPRDEEGWLSQPDWPIGDPTVSEVANYRVSLSLPEGYQALSSAPLDEEALALRDFSLVVTRDYASRQQTVDGTALTVRARNDEDAGRLMAMATNGFRFLHERYGAYPWPTLGLTQTAFPLGGMEHQGLVLVSDSYLKQGRPDDLELVVVHELAHQWFYALVGSDQAREPWLDEALCDWAVLSYVRAQYGQSAFESVMAARVDLPMRERPAPGTTAGGPIYDFLTLDDYVNQVYARGAGLMAAIDLDTERMDAFLKHYVATYRYQLVDRPTFESALNAFTDKDLSPLVADYLDHD